MNLIDICFNFTHNAFQKDPEAVLRRAKEAGVQAMLVAGSNLKDSAHGLELAERYHPVLSTGVGIHPHHAQLWTADTYQQLKELAAHKTVCAIGETGLDYNRDYSPRAIQREVFEQQIELAIETGLPLLMHQRDAHPDFMRILKPLRDKVTQGVVHCFTGDETMLKDYLDLDLYIGITGWICDERRGKSLQQLVKQIPLERLMVETDSPYLFPRTAKSALSGRRNEPCLLPYIVEQISACTQKPLDTIAQASYENSVRFFGLDASAL